VGGVKLPLPTSPHLTWCRASVRSTAQPRMSTDRYDIPAPPRRCRVKSSPKATSGCDNPSQSPRARGRSPFDRPSARDTTPRYTPQAPVYSNLPTVRGSFARRPACPSAIPWVPGSRRAHAGDARRRTNICGPAVHLQIPLASACRSRPCPDLYLTTYTVESAPPVALNMS